MSVCHQCVCAPLCVFACMFSQEPGGGGLAGTIYVSGCVCVCVREEETDTKRVREYGGRPESSSTQRKSFVQQMITLVEQMPHQLPVCSLPKSLNQGGTERD